MIGPPLRSAISWTLTILLGVGTGKRAAEHREILGEDT